MTLITTPGMHPHITPTQYFGEPCPSPALTNTFIKLAVHDTMADVAHCHPAIGQPVEEKLAVIAKRLGDVTHQIALGKGKGYRISDHERWDRRNKDVDAFLTGCERDGITPIKRKDYEAATEMSGVLREAIQSTLNSIAKARGVPVPEGGIPYETEVPFAWTETVDGVTVWCRGMLDVWCPLLMVALDPKITARTRDGIVNAHIENMGWATQGAFYLRGLEAIHPTHAGRIIFADVLVRPKAPHLVRKVKISEAWRTIADVDIRTALERFAEAQSTGQWPGFSDDIETLDAPSWAAKRALERELAEEMEDAQ